VNPLWRARHVAGVVIKAVSADDWILQERRIGTLRSGPLVITLPSPDAQAFDSRGTDDPHGRVELRPARRLVKSRPGPALLRRRRRKKSMTGGRS
jgi:hypothetical protein